MVKTWQTLCFWSCYSLSAAVWWLLLSERCSMVAVALWMLQYGGRRSLNAAVWWLLLSERCSMVAVTLWMLQFGGCYSLNAAVWWLLLSERCSMVAVALWMLQYGGCYSLNAAVWWPSLSECCSMVAVTLWMLQYGGCHVCWHWLSDTCHGVSAGDIISEISVFLWWIQTLQYPIIPPRCTLMCLCSSLVAFIISFSNSRVQGFFICHIVNYTGYNQKTWNVGIQACIKIFMCKAESYWYTVHLL